MSDQEKFHFDIQEGERRKEAGMSEAAARRAIILGFAKVIAVNIARERGEVTSDDVYAELLKSGYRSSELGPAAGAVFRQKELVWSGRWRKSERVSNHASDLRVWALRRGNVPAKNPLGLPEAALRFMEIQRQHRERIAKEEVEANGNAMIIRGPSVDSQLRHLLDAWGMHDRKAIPTELAADIVYAMRLHDQAMIHNLQSLLQEYRASAAIAPQVMEVPNERAD